MDEIDCCWLCWKSVVKEEAESENNGGPELDISRSRTYLDICIKYLKLESENLEEETEDLSNYCPLCLNCIEAAKKLTEIVDNLESLKRELDEYCSSFLDRLKNRRECVRLENMKSVKNVRRNRKKVTRNDDCLDLNEESITEGDNEVDGKLNFDTDESDFEGIDLEDFGGCNDNEEDSANLNPELNLDNGGDLIQNKVKARAGSYRNRNVVARRLKGKKSLTKINCSKCDKTFRNKSSFAAHNRIMHKRKNDRVCGECGIDFPRRRLLLHHVLKVHQTERPYKCSTCPKSFKWKNYLKRHEGRHTSERSYVCNRCDMAFFWAKNLVAHKKRVHPVPETSTPVSLSVSRTKTEKQGHKRMRSKPEISTPVAISESRTKTAKQGHKRMRPKPETLTPVAHSESRTKTDKYSQKRMRPMPVSGKYREYHCDRCGIIIKSGKAKFEDHKRLHTGEKPFNCEDCEECFRTKLNLKVHKTNVHQNEFPFECNQCEMKFKRRPQLIQHRTTAHSNPDHLIICEDCGKSFKRKGDYDLHRRVVHEKIKHKCQQCEKMFSRVAELTFHVKLVHTKEVQFVCHICGKESYCNRKLQDHIRTHTGEKPFQCPECGKHCTSKTALCYHLTYAVNHRVKRI